MSFDERLLFEPLVESPNVPSALMHEIDKYGGIYQVKVDDKVGMVFYIRPIRLGAVVKNYENRPTGAAKANEASGDERQTDQSVAPLYKK